MNHDMLFKELLTTFFVDFVQSFLPGVAQYLDEGSLEFLDKEVFTDITARERHEVDLLVKARFRDEEAFFLVHIENQASAQSDFPRRMFRYFARLSEKFDLPVYPVVIFSYDAPQRPELSRYRVKFPDKTVLQFDYTVIQLNRLSWRKFARQPNPAATALMAKMKIALKDRPKVMSECRRLLATLKLDPARAELIWTFVESYLKLTAEEFKQYERESAKLTPQEQEATMQIMSSFRREGLEQGLEQGVHQGQERLLTRIIERRFGAVSPATLAVLDRLSSDELDELGVNLLDFTSVTDLENWLSRHSSTSGE